MTASNNTIARFAAVVAMLGLLASSAFAFAPAARAAESTTDLQAQINALLAQIAALQGNTGTTAAVTFSQDLTLGSSGAQVTALQNWLISKGFAITAGATGYFGAQTQAALAKYQASAGITPASGYFGPITRAKVNAMAGTGTGTGTGTNTGSNNGGSLSGGEADLNDFKLLSEDSSGDEGEEGVDLATAEFDVDDGDARIERAELTFDSASSTLEDRPWQYFDTITVSSNGKEVGDVDASDRDEWDEVSTGTYTISLTGLDVVVEEGDTASLTFSADIADSIDESDLAQDFSIYVENDGIRATDAEGIQQYIGKTSDDVDFGFGEEDNGDLSIKAAKNEDPDASILVADDKDESEDYTVFAFNLDNKGDADSLVTDVTVNVATTSATLTNMVRRATLMVDGDEFDGDINYNTGEITFEDIDTEIAADDDMTFEVSVRLKGGASNGTIKLSVAAAGIEAEGVDSGDDADVSGSISGETHTVALTGVAVEAVSTSQSVTTPGQDATKSYGTYTIKFDVTALEDDAFISSTTFSGATTDGVGYVTIGNAFTGTTTAVLTSTADLVSGGRYQVDEGETETFTLTVTLDPSSTGIYGVRLDEVNFNDTNAAGDTVFTVDSSNEDFRTDTITIAN